jgi:hypothetical protein
MREAFSDVGTHLCFSWRVRFGGSALGELAASALGASALGASALGASARGLASELVL